MNNKTLLCIYTQMFGSLFNEKKNDKLVSQSSIFKRQQLKGNKNPHIKLTFIIKYSLLRTSSESLNKIRQRIRKLLYNSSLISSNLQRTIFKMVGSCGQLSIMFCTWNFMFFHFSGDWDNFLLWNQDMTSKNVFYMAYYEVGPWKHTYWKKI